MPLDCEVATCESYRAFGPVAEGAQTVEEAERLGYCHVCVVDLTAHLKKINTRELVLA